MKLEIPTIKSLDLNFNMFSKLKPHKTQAHRRGVQIIVMCILNMFSEAVTFEIPFTDVFIVLKL